MTSGRTLPEIRLSKIDDSNRHDHYHLTPDDDCYYLFEYTSHKDFTFGSANNLISNLKKSVERQGRPEYWYKTNAISECSRCIAGTLNDNWLRTATLVPIPPSKDRQNPLYDDRVTAICRGISAHKGYPVNVRELVEQQGSTNAAHESADRPSLEDLRGIYRIDEQIAAPPPTRIGIVDDVLTAGTHYRAVKEKLALRFPGVPITGIFIARRVFPDDAGLEFAPIIDHD
jgi:predicted amidophosphoribosyltransferase